MILFLEDWDRYPGAIVHKTTKNTSWLELAAKYKALGVKNYYFHLALINPLLADWDPRDPDLPEEIASLMLVEATMNPWYALREIITLPGKDPGEVYPILANRGNISGFWCMYAEMIVFMQQIRQTGKSLWGRCLVTDFHHFRNKRSQHLLYTKSDLRPQEIGHYKHFREALPRWAYIPDGKEADNQHAFTTNSRGNETKSYIPSGDPVGAAKVGRGTSPDLILADETPFCTYCAESISALVAAVSASFPKAKLHGTFHGIAYTTTAGDRSTREGEFVYTNLKKKAAMFGENMYDFQNKEALHKFIEITTGEVEPKVDITFNHRQLGYTDQWLRRTIDRNPGTRSEILRDHLNIWTFGSKENPIPEKILFAIKASLATPLQVFSEKYELYYKAYIPLDEIPKRTLVAGIDTSNATGNDSITVVAIDVETTETVFVASIVHTNLIHFANFLVELLEAFPLLTLIPEAKFNWQTIQDQLLIAMPLKNMDPGRRIYSRIVDRKDEGEYDEKTYTNYSQGYPTERKYRLYRDQFGFPTNAALREALYGDILNDATKLSGRVVRDVKLIDELSTLVKKNDRIDHAASGHDDHVIGWLAAQWFLRHARNLAHYGIEPRSVMSRVKKQEGPVDVKVELEDRRRDKIRAAIKEVNAKLDDSRNSIERRYYETRLLSLRMDLGDEDELSSGSVERRRVEARDMRSQSSGSRDYRQGTFSSLRKSMFK